MLKAVIFDMDGVILDSDRMIYNVEQKIFKDLGVDVKQGDHLAWVGTTADEFWAGVKEMYGLKQPVEELVANFRKASYDFFESNEFEPNPGFRDFLDSILDKGIKVALATSASFERSSLIIKKLGLEEVFKVRITARDVVKGKPDPEVFLKAAQRLGVDPSECVVIEDSRLGIKAANSAGMKSVGYNAVPGRQDLSEADLVVNGFDDLNYERLEALF